MKVDNVLKGHKECWKSYDVMDEPVVCDECPYKQYGDNCARHLIAETIEVLEEYKNLDRYKIYLEMKHEFLKQDAKNYVRDYIAYERGIAPWDVDDSELEDYDYEKLASEYEEKEYRENEEANATWQFIINDYMEDYGYESEDENE